MRHKPRGALVLLRSFRVIITGTEAYYVVLFGLFAVRYRNYYALCIYKAYLHKNQILQKKKSLVRLKRTLGVLATSPVETYRNSTNYYIIYSYGCKIAWTRSLQ